MIAASAADWPSGPLLVAAVGRHQPLVPVDDVPEVFEVVLGADDAELDQLDPALQVEQLARHVGRERAQLAARVAHPVADVLGAEVLGRLPEDAGVHVVRLHERHHEVGKHREELRLLRRTGQQVGHDRVVVLGQSRVDEVKLRLADTPLAHCAAP
jgi:hypothetical protein